MPTANRFTGITMLCLAATALAAPARAQSTVQLDIRSVVVSYKTTGEPDTLLISGVNFGSLPGLVRLNGIGQTVTHWTPTWIAATAQDVVEPGTYQLDVRRTDSTGTVFRDQADVTIGATGPRGPAGAEGPQGSPGISAYEVTELIDSAQNVVPGESVVKSLSCPTGKKVFGGGCSSGLDLYKSAPGNNSWECAWRAANNGSYMLHVYAICATIP